MTSGEPARDEFEGLYELTADYEHLVGHSRLTLFDRAAG